VQTGQTGTQTDNEKHVHSFALWNADKVSKTALLSSLTMCSVLYTSSSSSSSSLLKAVRTQINNSYYTTYAL